MPELPEVETTRRGIAPHVVGNVLDDLVVRNFSLRWPVDPLLPEQVRGACFVQVGRRGKYLLLETDRGHLIIHLGMSGVLRILPQGVKYGLHDHVDLVLSSGHLLRFTDPRRFGALLWTTEDPQNHPLLSHLGPEPLSVDFSTDWLYQRSRGRSCSIKSFIMDAANVVGVGNIYANEALFLAGIHPARAAGKIGRRRYERLVETIKKVLGDAIEVGGTTLKDFVGSDGKPGYFRQKLAVYGRGGESCLRCGELLEESRQGQRSTVFCSHCQR